MDLIILILLTWHIGTIARAKGLDVLKWRTLTVLVWLGLAIPVVVLSHSYTHNFFVATLSGILAGLLGYFWIRQYLEKQAGKEEEDQNDAGQPD